MRSVCAFALLISAALSTPSTLSEGARCYANTPRTASHILNAIASRDSSAGVELSSIESLEDECFTEINRLRRSHNRQPLEFSERLREVARDYSRRMAEERFFSHTDPEGRGIRDRVNAAGIRWKSLGENIATSRGYTNPVAVSVHGWMESEGHRANILSSRFNQTAVGVWISRNGTVYFTEIFLRR